MSNDAGPVYFQEWEHAVVTADNRIMAFVCSHVCYVLDNFRLVARFDQFKNYSTMSVSFDVEDEHLHFLIALRRRSSRARCRVLFLPVNSFKHGPYIQPSNLVVAHDVQLDSSSGEEEESPTL